MQHSDECFQNKMIDVNRTTRGDKTRVIDDKDFILTREIAFLFIFCPTFNDDDGVIKIVCDHCTDYCT